MRLDSLCLELTTLLVNSSGEITKKCGFLNEQNLKVDKSNIIKMQQEGIV